ncbi:MAG: sigma-70 family RNA polymerase sigma factor [Opitutaceae bacterium]|nr:sigma-70 family RNA polymerase sigma factor [Verrucomicrobiales bacterium]
MEATDKSDWIRSALAQHEGSLLRYALSITGDPDRARDVVQDTFLRLWSEDPVRLNGCLVEWLFTVCRHRAIDVQRKENRMTALTDIDLETRASAEPDPAQAAEQSESTGAVLRLLDTLPPNQREVIRLKFQNGLSYQEISRVTSLTVTNVGFLLHTGLKTLRAKLQSETRQPLAPRTP